MQENISEKQKDTRFKICKWIVFSIAVLLNCFIIFYSCISEETTARWNNSFTNSFTKLINGMTEKNTKQTPLESISVSFSNKEKHQFNYLEGYELDEIPLGSAKQVECSFFPADATNKSINYTASPSDLVQLNQSGSIVSIVGIKTGECILTAKSTDGSFESNLNFKVVETVAPTKYEISLSETEIQLGKTGTLNFDIDGGVLGHNELINFRYYDTRKLSFKSSNESIARIDENGVIHPVSIGSTTIYAANGEYSKSVDISIVDGVVPLPYMDLTISGSAVCYSNDMLLNQSNSEKYHYQLIPKDGEISLNPDDFIWESSNELLAKIDKHGVLRGFRKTSFEDEEVVITATSKTTGQSASMIVTVKSQLPTEMNISFIVDGKRVWNEATYTFTVGENIELDISYNAQVQNKQVVIESSDKSIVDFTNEGSIVTLHVKKVGECNIIITCVINPDLVREIKCSVAKAGAISKENYQSFGKYIRKSLGHAAVFMAAETFTFLTLFMFLYKKKWWFYSLIALGEGLFISGVSELIQFFVPSRMGTFIDVVINFGGVIAGALIAFLIILAINKSHKKKMDKQSK